MKQLERLHLFGRCIRQVVVESRWPAAVATPVSGLANQLNMTCSRFFMACFCHAGIPEVPFCCSDGLGAGLSTQPWRGGSPRGQTAWHGVLAPKWSQRSIWKAVWCGVSAQAGRRASMGGDQAESSSRKERLWEETAARGHTNGGEGPHITQYCHQN